MKKSTTYLTYILFIFIGTILSVVSDELLNYINGHFSLNWSDNVMRYSSIGISCLVGWPIAEFLTRKILRHKKSTRHEKQD